MYPDEEQKILLEKHIGSCGFFCNHFLDLWNRQYVETGKGMSYKEMTVSLTALKKRGRRLNEVNSQSLQRLLIYLDSAFHGFFKNTRNSGKRIIQAHLRFHRTLTSAITT